MTSLIAFKPDQERMAKQTSWTKTTVKTYNKAPSNSLIKLWTPVVKRLNKNRRTSWQTLGLTQAMRKLRRQSKRRQIPRHQYKKRSNKPPNRVVSRLMSCSRNNETTVNPLQDADNTTTANRTTTHLMQASSRALSRADLNETRYYCRYLVYLGSCCR